MKLLLLNDHYFNTLPPVSGVDVLRIGAGDDQDIPFNPETDNLVDVLVKADFTPDAVLQVDSIDGRFFAPGLEELRVPTAFYAIDAPINAFWQTWYAHGFDRVFVDQHEEWRRWREQGITWARWLPLAADMTLYHQGDAGAERDLDVVFVGTLDGELRPKRSAILHRLMMVAKVHLVDGGGTRSEVAGNVANLYRRAKIILNENLFDGINLRTFEAMASGAVVLTEAGRGQDRLFKESAHLVSYTTENLEDVVTDLLANPEKLRRIGEQGAQRIRDKHTLMHRFKQVLSELSVLQIRTERTTDANRRKMDWGLWQAMWKWPENWPQLRQRIGKRLLDEAELLYGMERAAFQEALGNREEAVKSLLETIEIYPNNRRAIAALAALALSVNDLKTVRKILSADADADAAELHTLIGKLLEEAGEYFTPGFNRQASPITGWSAFEHYHRAWSLNEDHRPALEGLDRILSTQKAPEFTWKMWQRYHARHPMEQNVQDILRARACEGFLMCAKKQQEIPANVRRDPRVARWSVPASQTERAAG